MATITQMTFKEIITVFNNRVEKTNVLKKELEKNGGIITGNIDIEIQVYFKYYFDIYTTVERTIRCIVFEMAKKHKLINYYGDPSNFNKPYLVSKEELESIIDNKGITLIIPSNSSFRRVLANRIEIISPTRKQLNILNEIDFYEKYDKLRKDRNQLAHGLESTSNVEFSESRLQDNLSVLYYLLHFYKKTIK
ncbi:MAG TPA: hypothetical protein PLR26_04630 [Bacilli bacterium]|nr:hypothetical protein [Bacilli bacterium]